ncbi:MAG: F-box protein [Chlamydiia bacterium]|nr:F-box protein [Chlamydiia bacterium]
MWTAITHLFGYVHPKVQPASNGLVSLPNEILLKIFELLERGDLASLGRTCREMRSLTKGPIARLTFPPLLVKNVALSFFDGMPRVNTDIEFPKGFPLNFSQSAPVVWGLDGRRRPYLSVRYTYGGKEKALFILYQEFGTKWQCLDSRGGMTAYYGKAVHWQNVKVYFPSFWTEGQNPETEPFIQALFKNLSCPTPITQENFTKLDHRPESSILLA